jgi:hypothetical protein
MKTIAMKVLIAIGAVVAAGFLQAASAGSQTIKSYTDASGNRHPATAKVSTPVSVTCTSVSGTNASCYITGAGIDKQVPKDHNIFTIEAGTVTLICNGSGPLGCEARIDPIDKKAADQ